MPEKKRNEKKWKQSLLRPTQDSCDPDADAAACLCLLQPALLGAPSSFCARADAMEERCGEVAGVRWTGRDDVR